VIGSRHTFEAVVRELRESLADGTIILPRGSPLPRSPGKDRKWIRPLRIDMAFAWAVGIVAAFVLGSVTDLLEPLLEHPVHLVYASSLSRPVHLYSESAEFVYTVKLANTSNVPATDLDVTIDAPSGFILKDPVSYKISPPGAASLVQVRILEVPGDNTLRVVRISRLGKGESVHFLMMTIGPRNHAGSSSFHVKAISAERKLILRDQSPAPEKD
jgi:hypothetical protein